MVPSASWDANGEGHSGGPVLDSHEVPC